METQTIQETKKVTPIAKENEEADERMKKADKLIAKAKEDLKPEPKVKTKPAEKEKKKNGAKYDYKIYIGRLSYPTEIHMKLKKIAEKKETTISKLYTEAITQFVKKNS